MANKKNRKLPVTTPEMVDVTKMLYPDLVPVMERDDITEMEVPERKRRLSRFARENIYTPSGNPHRMPAILSITELNKMDGSYAPQRHQHQHVVFEVVMVDRPKRQDERDLLEAESPVETEKDLT